MKLKALLLCSVLGLGLYARAADFKWEGSYKLIQADKGNSPGMACADTLIIQTSDANCGGYKVSSLNKIAKNEVQVQKAESEFCKINQGEKRIPLGPDKNEPIKFLEKLETATMTSATLKKKWQLSSMHLYIGGGAFRSGLIEFTGIGSQLNVDYRQSALNGNLEDPQVSKIVGRCSYQRN